MCEQGHINDAQKVGSLWIIPEDAQKPVDARVKNGKYIKYEKKSDEVK